MKINGVLIEDATAEAFESPYAKICITGSSNRWVQNTSASIVGCATSIIACGCEAGIEAKGISYKTPDGRDGNDILFFSYKKESLEKELIKRVGQICLPAPTISVFNSLSEGKPFDLGEKIGLFGNGFQHTVNKHGRELIAIPITSGEFLIEKNINIATGIGGANFWIYAKSYEAGLKSAERAVSAIEGLPNLILPFVGGIVASPSRVGSRYKGLTASTQEDFCPTISSDKNPNKRVGDDTGAIFEIIIDATSIEVAKEAIGKAIKSACIDGVNKIGATDFGGKLGAIKIPIRGTL